MNCDSFIGCIELIYGARPIHVSCGSSAGLNARVFPDHGLPFEVAGGICHYLHPGNQFEYLLLRGENYQASLKLFHALQNLNQGDIVAVAGISFGQQVILASQAVGATGCVVAIDPSPNALLRTRMNLTLNSPTANVRLVSCWPRRASYNSCHRNHDQWRCPFRIIYQARRRIPVFCLCGNSPTDPSTASRR